MTCPIALVTHSIRRILCILFFVALFMFLPACTPLSSESPDPATSTYTFSDVFDTASIILSTNPEGFEERAKFYHESLLEYHKLFDIYHSYSGMTNLKDLNDHAGQGPIPVDTRILSLLKMGQDWYARTQSRLNLAMGAVLRLWHEAREISLEHPEETKLPDPQALQEAAQHCDFGQVRIDMQKGTVEILDSKLQLDVGALGKGFAVEAIAQAALERGWTQDLLNIGGCVRAIGMKDADRGKGWNVGIQSPRPTPDHPYLHLLELQRRSLVTSGSYERYFVYKERSYSHIIDPKTLQPADRYGGLSILTERADIGDALSTALFLLSEEEGRKLIQEIPGTEVLWVYPDLKESLTPGLSRYLRPLPS